MTTMTAYTKVGNVYINHDVRWIVKVIKAGSAGVGKRNKVCESLTTRQLSFVYYIIFRDSTLFLFFMMLLKLLDYVLDWLCRIIFKIW